MFASTARNALRASLQRQAGYTTYRTTMVEAVVRAGRDHNDVKVIYGFCVLGSALLFGIFYHSAKDPRYFFGTNRSNDNYKKYMTKRQWCMTTGRGLRFREASNLSANARGFTDWMRTDRYHGLKLDWQKDIYQLILDIHAADPKDYVSPKPEVIMEHPAVDPRKFGAYDQALLGILQNEGKIELFLDMMFSFLYRKTDYFRLLTPKSPNKNLGFPPGVAGKMVSHYFEKYMKLSLASYEDMIEKMEKLEAEKSGEVSEIKDDNTNSSKTLSKSESVKISENTSTQVNYSTPELTNEPEHENSEPIKNNEKLTKSPKPSTNDTEALSFNGQKCEKYSWSQNYDDIDVTINLPPTETSKTIKIDIKQAYLNVKTSSDTIIDEPLKFTVIPDESTWTFDKKQHQLTINLTKKEKRWWDGLLPSEKAIDVQKDVEATRPMDDLPEDELAVIRKLQFDQHQKRLGKPTSKELTVHEQLKKGWNAEGSPFKGTDFDPSKFNIS